MIPKFRVWTIQGRYWGRPHVGGRWFLSVDGKLYETYLDETGSRRVDECSSEKHIVSFSIDMKDKNGKDVYFEDFIDIHAGYFESRELIRGIITRDKHNLPIIKLFSHFDTEKWHPIEAEWELKVLVTGGTSFEIIGNRFEHPELLAKCDKA